MLDDNQIQMLLHLKGTSKSNPFRLGNIFNLKEKINYRAYVDLSTRGFIGSDKSGEWITAKGANELTLREL